jgi:hypothetical protein
MATYNAYGGIEGVKQQSGGVMNDQDLFAYMRQYASDPNKMRNFLRTQNLTPEMAAKVLEANNAGGMADVNYYLQQNPQAAPGSFGGDTAGAAFQGPVAGGGSVQSSMQAGRQAPTMQPPVVTNEVNANSFYRDPGRNQQNGFASDTGPNTDRVNPGDYPGNPYLPNPTRSPYQPMAGGGMPAGGFSANPYTDWMASSIGGRLNQNLQRNLMPGIRNGAIAAGGLGGSRQGVAEGVAIGDTNRAYGDALAGLYSGQFNADRNYGLQSDALDLNVYNANQNWMNQGQQNQLGFLDRMLGWNSQGLNTATNAQNTPLNYYSQFTNLGTQLGGMGGTQSQNMQGNPWLGALGGALAGYDIYKNWK